MDPEVYSWLYIIIVGSIAGWIGGQVMKGASYGIIGNIVIGIIGSFIGGWLFDFLKIDTPNNMVGSIITAAAGAIVLLWVAKLVKN